MPGWMGCQAGAICSSGRCFHLHVDALDSVVNSASPNGV